MLILASTSINAETKLIKTKTFLSLIFPDNYFFTSQFLFSMREAARGFKFAISIKAPVFTQLN